MRRLVHRFLPAVLAVLCLAACQTTGSYPATGDAPAATKVDAKVAAVSEQLAKQCVIVKSGMMIASGFVHDERVKQVINVAKPSVDRFCDAPPANVADAIRQLTALALDINAAIAAAEPTTAPAGG